MTTWSEAVDYCEQLGSKHGYEGRLLTVTDSESLQFLVDNYPGSTYFSSAADYDAWIGTYNMCVDDFLPSSSARTQVLLLKTQDCTKRERPPTSAVTDGLRTSTFRWRRQICPEG